MRINRRHQKALKVVATILGMVALGYVLTPPLYWHVSEGLSSTNPDCPACDCDCTSQPLFSFSEGLMNTTFPDCAKHDQEVSKDMENNFTDMLFEELKQKEAQSLDSENKANTMLLEAKRMASQYQKEADKCSSGMETCEEARERSEGMLEEQRRLSSMWELRARQRGWREGGGAEQQVQQAQDTFFQ
ncbi:hypothetical protein MLD38_033534 [Melastoma candidum]|uniref:Uncharacterized protein n=1 Tax=Melastoma candidum TaxID=119954 RepID=A0ACB9M8W5_9MYRT|nr:hypothetical protein MLD38_033534 [Melastoma candidum]